MNEQPKNTIKNETEKITDNKNESSTPKNKDSSLFSFLPKEILDEIETPEAVKYNANSTKMFLNYSDIPEFPKINEKPEKLHQSPDSKMKYRRLPEQKQVKKPEFSGNFSNSDNTMDNSNTIRNTQTYFNQNDANKNLGQWNYQSAQFFRKYSDSNSNTNMAQNMNNINTINFNNVNNNRNGYNNNNINRQINVNNMMNNMANTNRMNNMNNMNKIK